MAKLKLTQIRARSASRSATAARCARSASARSADRRTGRQPGRSQACFARCVISSRSEEQDNGRRAEPLEPAARAAAPGPQARRPRPRLRQGALLGPRDQGPEVALGLARDARRLRGRPDAALHAHGQAARQHVQGRDAGRPVPHLHAAGQPARPRGSLRGRRRGHARGAQGEGADPHPPQGREAARRRRPDQEAHDHRARRFGDRAREGRGVRRHADAAQGAEGAQAEEPGSAAPGGQDARRRAETEDRDRRSPPESET